MRDCVLFVEVELYLLQLSAICYPDEWLCVEVWLMWRSVRSLAVEGTVWRISLYMRPLLLAVDVDSCSRREHSSWAKRS